MKAKLKKALGLVIGAGACFTIGTSFAGLEVFETKTSTTGAKFVRVADERVLGEGWEAPNGLIWYDAARYEEGDLVRTSWDIATRFCEERKARLPTIDEWRTLGSFFGAIYSPSGSIDLSKSQYKPQILPNLDYNSFWSSSLHSSNDDAWVFGGLDGGISVASHIHDRRDGMHVRCVQEAYTRLSDSSIL